MINDLTSKGKGFLKNNQLLQELYLDLIEEQLKMLDDGAVDMQSTLPIPLSTHENTTDSEAKQCKFIYQLLSYMDPSPEMLSLSQHLDELFKNLISWTNRAERSCLDKGIIYSCLLSQSNTYLIEKFSSIENQMRFLVDGHSELPLSRSAVQGFKQHSLSVGPHVQICYTQSFMKDRKSAWQYLFFHALEGNHVLENVVVRFDLSGDVIYKN